jgi:hypothetical protein
VALDGTLAGELPGDDQGLEVAPVTVDLQVLAIEAFGDVPMDVFGGGHVRVRRWKVERARAGQ